MIRHESRATATPRRSEERLAGTWPDALDLARSPQRLPPSTALRTAVMTTNVVNVVVNEPTDEPVFGSVPGNPARRAADYESAALTAELPARVGPGKAIRVLTLL